MIYQAEHSLSAHQLLSRRCQTDSCSFIKHMKNLVLTGKPFWESKTCGFVAPFLSSFLFSPLFPISGMSEVMHGFVYLCRDIHRTPNVCPADQGSGPGNTVCFVPLGSQGHAPGKYCIHCNVVVLSSSPPEGRLRSHMRNKRTRKTNLRMPCLIKS